MRWLSSLDGPTTKLRTRKQKFDRKKVINLEMGTNRFGKPTAILHYRRLPAMVGLKPMLDTFPDLTPTQVQELYSDYGIALPGTFKKAFKERKQPDPDPVDGEPDGSIPLDERPLRIPEPYQPLDEEIQPPDKKVLWGYIHATGLYPRRGKVMGSNPIHVGDIPIKNVKELKKFWSSGGIASMTNCSTSCGTSSWKGTVNSNENLGNVHQPTAMEGVPSESRSNQQEGPLQSHSGHR